MKRISNSLLKIRAKRLEYLQKKDIAELSIQEKTEITYIKWEMGQKITYEEFVLMLRTGDELAFVLGNTEYEIINSFPQVILFFTEYRDGHKLKKKSLTFNSIDELLINYKINNMTIKDLWTEIEF